MSDLTSVIAPEPPVTQRLRLDTVKRRLTVAEKFFVTPNMIRVVLAGDELEGFTSPGADDNIKMFVPDADGNTVMRSYTPRRYDAITNRLEVDFAVHEAGPATRWALDVKVGDEAVIGGPRGSKLTTGDIAEWVLIADETAIPALARFLEDGGRADRFRALIAVPGKADEQTFETVSEVDANWIYRDGTDHGPADAAPYLQALSGMEFREKTYFWIAAEGGVVRTIRDWLNTERCVDLRWIRGTGYWVAGKADATEKFD